MVTVIDLENVHLACINQKFGHNPKTGRLFATAQYKDFKKLLVMSAKKGAIKAPYHVKIEFSGRADIDAHIKPILDSLQIAGVIDNDKNVKYLEVLKRDLQKKGETRVTVGVETIKGYL